MHIEKFDASCSRERWRHRWSSFIFCSSQKIKSEAESATPEAVREKPSAIFFKLAAAHASWGHAQIKKGPNDPYTLYLVPHTLYFVLHILYFIPLLITCCN